VLDSAMAPCPDMVPGELFIGGAGLARGYWRDAARTAERFVADPRTGARLYRTGDMGRWREDGLIEFLGRRDGLVKIGGHRVELGEVEAGLARQAGVTQAVAVAPADAAGRRRLVGFCAASGTTAEAIRTGAARLLPAYMVPAEIRLLASLPRNANDKVDRRALEEMAAGAAPIALPPPGAEDTAGRMLAIWRDVLGTSSLAATDNLFEAGATSFSAVQAVARIARDVAPCSVTDLFEFPTVAALAAHLARDAAPPSATAPPPEPPADTATLRAAKRRAARATAMAEDEA
jgi:hypothetical protein